MRLIKYLCLATTATAFEHVLEEIKISTTIHSEYVQTRGLGANSQGTNEEFFFSSSKQSPSSRTPTTQLAFLYESFYLPWT